MSCATCANKLTLCACGEWACGQCAREMECGKCSCFHRHNHFPVVLAPEEQKAAELVASNDVELLRVAFAQPAWDKGYWTIGKFRSNFATTWFIIYSDAIIYTFPVAELPEKVSFVDGCAIDHEQQRFFWAGAPVPLVELQGDARAEQLGKVAQRLVAVGLNLKGQ